MHSKYTTGILFPVSFKKGSGFTRMITITEIPTLWNRLAETMHLKDSSTGEVTLSEHASFSFGRVKSSKGLPEIARPIAGERDYLVS